MRHSDSHNHHVSASNVHSIVVLPHLISFIYSTGACTCTCTHVHVHMAIEARQRKPVTPEDSYFFRQKEGAASGKTWILHTMQMLHHHEPHTLVVILFSTRDSVPRGAYFVMHGRPCSAPYPCTQSHMYMYTLGDCLTSGPRAFLSLGSCGSLPLQSACAHTCMQFMQYMYMH